MANLQNGLKIFRAVSKIKFTPYEIPSIDRGVLNFKIRRLKMHTYYQRNYEKKHNGVRKNHTIPVYRGIPKEHLHEALTTIMSPVYLQNPVLEVRDKGDEDSTLQQEIRRKSNLRATSSLPESGRASTRLKVSFSESENNLKRKDVCQAPEREWRSEEKRAADKRRSALISAEDRSPFNIIRSLQQAQQKQRHEEHPQAHVQHEQQQQQQRPRPPQRRGLQKQLSNDESVDQEELKNYIGDRTDAEAVNKLAETYSSTSRDLGNINRKTSLVKSRKESKNTEIVCKNTAAAENIINPLAEGASRTCIDKTTSERLTTPKNLSPKKYQSKNDIANNNDIPNLPKLEVLRSTLNCNAADKVKAQEKINSYLAESVKNSLAGKVTPPLSEANNCLLNTVLQYSDKVKDSDPRRDNKSAKKDTVSCLNGKANLGESKTTSSNRERDKNSVSLYTLENIQKTMLKKSPTINTAETESLNQKTKHYEEIDDNNYQQLIQEGENLLEWMAHQANSEVADRQGNSELHREMPKLFAKVKQVLNELKNDAILNKPMARSVYESRREGRARPAHESTLLDTFPSAGKKPDRFYDPNSGRRGSADMPLAYETEKEQTNCSEEKSRKRFWVDKLKERKSAPGHLSHYHLVNKSSRDQDVSHMLTSPNQVRSKTKLVSSNQTRYRSRTTEKTLTQNSQQEPVRKKDKSKKKNSEDLSTICSKSLHGLMDNKSYGALLKKYSTVNASQSELDVKNKVQKMQKKIEENYTNIAQRETMMDFYKKYAPSMDNLGYKADTSFEPIQQDKSVILNIPLNSIFDFDKHKKKEKYKIDRGKEREKSRLREEINTPSSSNRKDNIAPLSRIVKKVDVPSTRMSRVSEGPFRKSQENLFNAEEKPTVKNTGKQSPTRQPERKIPVEHENNMSELISIYNAQTEKKGKRKKFLRNPSAGNTEVPEKKRSKDDPTKQPPVKSKFHMSSKKERNYNSKTASNTAFLSDVASRIKHRYMLFTSEDTKNVFNYKQRMKSSLKETLSKIDKFALSNLFVKRLIEIDQEPSTRKGVQSAEASVCRKQDADSVPVANYDNTPTDVVNLTRYRRRRRNSAGDGSKRTSTNIQASPTDALIKRKLIPDKVLNSYYSHAEEHSGTQYTKHVSETDFDNVHISQRPPFVREKPKFERNQDSGKNSYQRNVRRYVLKVPTAFAKTPTMRRARDTVFSTKITQNNLLNRMPNNVPKLKSTRSGNAERRAILDKYEPTRPVNRKVNTSSEKIKRQASVKGADRVRRVRKYYSSTLIAKNLLLKAKDPRVDDWQMTLREQAKSPVEGSSKKSYTSKKSRPVLFTRKAVSSFFGTRRPVPPLHDGGGGGGGGSGRGKRSSARGVGGRRHAFVEGYRYHDKYSGPSPTQYEDEYKYNSKEVDFVKRKLDNVRHSAEEYMQHPGNKNSIEVPVNYMARKECELARCMKKMDLTGVSLSSMRAGSRVRLVAEPLSDRPARRKRSRSTLPTSQVQGQSRYRAAYVPYSGKTVVDVVHSGIEKTLPVPSEDKYDRSMFHSLLAYKKNEEKRFKTKDLLANSYINNIISTII